MIFNAHKRICVCGFQHMFHHLFIFRQGHRRHNIGIGSHRLESKMFLQGKDTGILFNDGLEKIIFCPS